MEPFHVVVSIGLGKDTGSGYRHVLPVALDHSEVRDSQTRCGREVRNETIAVNEYMTGFNAEHAKSAVHSHDRGSEDIEAVDLLSSRLCYSPRHSRLLDDRTQEITLRLRELLRVVETLVLEIIREDDSGSKHATGQRTATRLITSRLRHSFDIMVLKHLIVFVLSRIES